VAAASGDKEDTPIRLDDDESVASIGENFSGRVRARFEKTQPQGLIATGC
jgi:hypothetical protein